MNNMQEILQNCLTVKDYDGHWQTLVAGTRFRAVNTLGEVCDYLFLGRDFFESPHGEDYWTVQGNDYQMVVETEWFRQRKIGLIENPHNCLISITAEDSEFGTEYVQFTIPEGVDEEDVLNALKEAKEELEEDTSLVNEDDSAEEITMKIVERAAEIVCGKYRYIDVDEFEYEYDWAKWYEDHKEEEE